MRRWSLDDAFKKAINPQYRSPQIKQVMKFYNEGDDIPIHVWKETLIKAAKIVDRWGPEYLPIFERVEIELENAKKRLQGLEKARQLASDDLADRTLGQ